MVLVWALFDLLRNNISFEHFLITFAASTACVTVLFWIGRHLGLVRPPAGISSDYFQAALNTLFVTTLLGALITSATKLVAIQTSTAEEQEQRYYNPSDVFFGDQDFCEARRELMIGAPESQSLRSANLTAEKVIYIRYVTARKQVQIERYVGLKRVDATIGGTLKLTYQAASGSLPAEISYFMSEGGVTKDIEVQKRPVEDRTYSLTTYGGSSITVLKYYADFEFKGDFFITPLFQIRDPKLPNVDEYVVLSTNDSAVWNPNKYLFDISAAPGGTHKKDRCGPERPMLQLSFSSQIYVQVGMNSTMETELSDIIAEVLSARCNGDDCGGSARTKDMLSEIFDKQTNQLKSNFTVFKSTSHAADVERALWYKLCPGGDGCQ